MAAVKPEIWEKANELVESACKQDNNVRLKVGPQLILFLDGKGKLDGRQSDQLIDAMNDWIQSSNFKVSVMNLITCFEMQFMRKYCIKKGNKSIVSVSIFEECSKMFVSYLNRQIYFLRKSVKSCESKLTNNQKLVFVQQLFLQISEKLT